MTCASQVMHRTANRGPPSPRPRSASAAGRSLRQPAASLYWSACRCPAAAGCPSPRSVSPRPTQLGSAADGDWRSAQTVRSGSSLMNSKTTLVSTRIARARRVVARRPARASTFAADDLERLAQGHKAVSVPAGSSQRPRARQSLASDDLYARPRNSVPGSRTPINTGHTVLLACTEIVPVH